MSHKMAPFKGFAKLYISPLLIANIVKSAVSGLRKLLPTESHWKIMKKVFYFILTNWICYFQIGFILLILSIFIKPNIWYSWSLKKMAIKRWFPFNWLLFSGEWNKKLQTFSRHFFWELPSKFCIAEFTANFVCLLLSWSEWYSMNWSSNFDGRCHRKNALP